MDKLSGYIEVELGGELRPLKFGMGAWKLIAEERGKPLEELFSGLDDFEFISMVTFAGLKFAALADYTDLPAPKNVYVVYDWLNDAPPEIYKQIGKAFADSKIVGQTMRDYMAKQQGNTDNSTVKKKTPLKK